MSGPPDEVRELFAAANFAHMASVGPEGPSSVPVWVDVEGDVLVMFTQSVSRKARHVRHDARVALSVVDRDDPYRQADVRGRVVAVVDGEAAQAVADRLARKYTGVPLPWRSPDTIAWTIAVDAVHHVRLPFEDRPA